jgi:hypothetical protein
MTLDKILIKQPKVHLDRSSGVFTVMSNTYVVHTALTSLKPAFMLNCIGMKESSVEDS